MYLIYPDFKKLIQTDNLSAIIGGDYTLLDSVMSAAQSEITSYLTQKYDTLREFSDTLLWSRAVSYKGNQRVYLDAAAYSAASTYALNALTLQAGNVYICTTAIIAAEAFTVGHWALLGVQYAMFYVTLPYPEFDFNSVYAKGGQVWWKDKTYTNLLPTQIQTHGSEIQYDTYLDLPKLNFYPDLSAASWGTGTSFSLAAGVLPTASGWTAGDNRNPQLVNNCIDIALYIIHSRIAPRNIPELRIKRYDDVIKWLKDVAQGKNITATLSLKTPGQGMRIRWGSEIRKDNNY